MQAHLVGLGIAFRQTHDLAVLAALQPEEMQAQLEGVDLQVLRQWAVDARYSAELPESSLDDAAAARAIASLIVDVMLEAQPPDALSRASGVPKKARRKACPAYQISIGLIHLDRCSLMLACAERSDEHPAQRHDLARIGTA